MRQNARSAPVKHAQMTAARRSPPARSRTRSALGSLLADLRVAKGFSLRQVEQATDREVSNAYLSQLEQGKIQQPSPSILHRLAAVYAVPYEALMEKAGYLLPSAEGDSRGRRQRLAAFAIDDLTAEEEEELLKYLAFIRSRKR
jgi:transcriptional regulator with XRE-family HTH domain